MRPVVPGGDRAWWSLHPPAETETLTKAPGLLSPCHHSPRRWPFIVPRNWILSLQSMNRLRGAVAPGRGSADLQPLSTPVPRVLDPCSNCVVPGLGYVSPPLTLLPAGRCFLQHPPPPTPASGSLCSMSLKKREPGHISHCGSSSIWRL